MINHLKQVFELPHMKYLRDIWPLWGIFVTVYMVYMIRMDLGECTISRGGEKRALGPK